MLKRLKSVSDSEKFSTTPEGFQALIFTAEGDMRYALNNMQATAAGFDQINQENVFKVCDQPHPDLMQNVIKSCLMGKLTDACSEIDKVFNEGYNIVDLINTLTRVIQNMKEFPKDATNLFFIFSCVRNQYFKSSQKRS